MAQDHPPTSGQGYPHDTTGQQPMGYDYQHTWYPPQQEATPADPWGGTGYAPPYAAEHLSWHGQPTGEWDAGLPQQREPEAYYTDPYGYQGVVSDQGYGQQTPVADQGYGADQHLYAPPGAEQAYGGYVPYGQPMPAADAPTPFDTPTPFDGATPFDATTPFDGPAPADGPTPFGAPSPFDAPNPFDGPGPDETYESDPAEPPARASLVDRAKAAAETVISADHSPSRRALAIRAGAGVAALAVLITAGVLATGGDSGPAPAGDAQAPQNITVAHTRTWSIQPTAAAPAGTDDSLVGSWLLADTVVRADGSGVQAYNLADGKPAWSIAPPGNGAVPCGLSPTVNAAGLGAAVFRPAADPSSPCTTLAVVDTKTGKTTWTKSLSDAKGPYAAHVAVLEDKVIAVGDDKAAAWASADGKDLWQYTGQGKFCSLSGNASGSTVLLHSTCADSTPADQAVALTAADGKVRWWRGLNNQPKTVTVLSAEPAAVLTTGDKPSDDRVFAWGDSGDAAAEIPVSGDAGRLDVAHGSFDPVPGVYFHDHTMVATVTPADGGTPAVTAYDLTTGKPAWKTAVAEKGKSRPVGLDSGGLLLAVDERLDQPGHISRFALAGGQETQGGAFPQGTGSLLTSGRLLSGGGRVISVPEHSSNFGTATAFQSKA